MEYWRGRTALVTGASAGIGAAFAEQLAACGSDLVLTARRVARLEAIASKLRKRHGIRVDAIGENLAEDGDAGRLMTAVERLGRPIGVLVNNAGSGVAGPFAETSWLREQQMLHLNMLGLVELTKCILPPMLARQRGDILLVGSVLGYIPAPLHACYAASKAFVRSFGEAIGGELEGTNVHVLVVNPGRTHTEFFASAGYRGTGPRRFTMTADAVVREALRAAAHHQRTCVPGFSNRLIVATVRVLPIGVRLRVMKRVQRAAGAHGADVA